MKLVTLRIPDAELAEIDRRAAEAGMSRSAYIRAAATDGELKQMVREIHKAICNGTDCLPHEAQDAVAALVTTGLSQAVATRRVKTALADNPNAHAADLIAAALKET